MLGNLVLDEGVVEGVLSRDEAVMLCFAVGFSSVKEISGGNVCGCEDFGMGFRLSSVSFHSVSLITAISLEATKSKICNELQVISITIVNNCRDL